MSRRPMTSRSGKCNLGKPPKAGSDVKGTLDVQRASIIAELEKHTRAIVDAINARDWESEELSAWTVPHFHASNLDVFPPTTTWTAHLDTFKAIATESPTYHMHIEDLRVDVGASLDSAKVFITAEISGRPVELKRKSLGVLSWVLFPSGWKAVSHDNMRQVVQL